MQRLLRCLDVPTTPGDIRDVLYAGFSKTRIILLLALMAAAIYLRIRWGQFFTREGASIDFLMLSAMASGVAYLIQYAPTFKSPKTKYILWKLRLIVPIVGGVVACASALIQWIHGINAYLLDLAALGFNAYWFPFQEIMDKRVLARQPSDRLFASPIKGTPGQWQSFTSLKGRFSCEMPGYPGEGTFDQEGEQANITQLDLSDGPTFVVVWMDNTDLPGLDTASDDSANWYIKQVIGELVTNQDTIGNEYRLQLNGYPGRGFRYLSRDIDGAYSMEARIYLVKARIYFVFSNLKTDTFQNREAADRFIQSFSVVTN